MSYVSRNESSCLTGLARLCQRHGRLESQSRGFAQEAALVAVEAKAGSEFTGSCIFSWGIRIA